MKYTFTLICVLLATLVTAQREQIVLKGTVTLSGGAPLKNVSINETHSKKSVLSKSDGSFKLIVPIKNIHIKATYQGYSDYNKTYSIKELQQAGDTLNISIVLEEKTEILQGVDIEVYNIELVHKKPNILVLDYEFYGNDFLLLIKEKSIYKLRHQDEFDSLITELVLNTKPKKLYKDCLDNYHVLTADSAYEVVDMNNRLALYKGISRTTFDMLLGPCVASTTDALYFEKYAYNNQWLLYYNIQKQTGEKQPVRSICDKKMANGISWYGNKSMRELMKAPDRMGDIDTGMIKKYRKAQNAVWFTERVLNLEVYHPLIKTNHSIYIFDHVSDSVFIYDLQGRPKENHVIAYHKSKGWDKEVITDISQNKFYARVLRNGKVHLLELGGDFSVASEHTLEKHSFPENIKVRNGYAYYLYNPKEYDFSVKNLYRQRLK